MGLLNINFIGAFIVTIVLLAVAVHRPPVARWEERISQFDLPAQLIVVTLFALVGAGTFASILWPESLPLPLRLFFAVIHNINLLIHEAGHVYWSVVGLRILGGSLNQIAIPLLFAGALFFKNCRRVACLFLFWAGQNLPSIGSYAADANAQRLPLLGHGRHDWNTLLSDAGLIQYDQLVATSIYCLGIALMALSLCLYLLNCRSASTRIV